MITIKEGQEGSLSASCALDPSEAKVILRTLKVSEVHQQILYPNTRSFSNCGQLGRPETKQLKPSNAQTKNMRFSILLILYSNRGFFITLWSNYFSVKKTNNQQQ
jgi:hypothetical protein